LTEVEEVEKRMEKPTDWKNGEMHIYMYLYVYTYENKDHICFIFLLNIQNLA
jgi:hypothetical protein